MADEQTPGFTPGPWEIDWRRQDMAYIGPSSDQTVYIAEVHSTLESGPFNDADRGNAYLLASAPELLEALEQLTESVMLYTGNRPAIAYPIEATTLNSMVEITERAEVAIRKARGR